MSDSPKPTSVPVSDSVELRLIPEYGGDTSPEEWLQKTELVCSLRGIARLETVIPLRLIGGAFAVYQQMPDADKLEAAKIKEALLRAFGTDSFVAYEEFTSRRLRSGEPVEVYLADLKKLASSFGGIPEKALLCAFVAGLPERVRQTLRAGSRMEGMELHEIVARARAVIADDQLPSVCAAEVGRRNDRSPLVCFECQQPNHLARDCLLRQRPGGRSGRTDRKQRRCYRCGNAGHLASACQGNGGGEELSSAPLPSPRNNL